MVMPLLGVKTRCADKSAAEHYEHTYNGFSSLKKKKITSMMGAPCNTLFMRCLEYLADIQTDPW